MIKKNDTLINKLVLIDYGLSGESPTKEQKGTILYMDPSIVLSQKLSVKSDIWSLGITLIHYLYNNLGPFQNTPSDSMYSYLNNTSKAKSSSKMETKIKWGSRVFVDSRFDQQPALIDLLYNMLQLDQEKRFSINEVINHYWFQ